MGGKGKNGNGSGKKFAGMHRLAKEVGSGVAPTAVADTMEVLEHGVPADANLDKNVSNEESNQGEELQSVTILAQRKVTPNILSFRTIKWTQAEGLQPCLSIRVGTSDDFIAIYDRRAAIVGRCREILERCQAEEIDWFSAKSSIINELNSTPAFACIKEKSNGTRYIVLYDAQGDFPSRAKLSVLVIDQSRSSFESEDASQVERTGSKALFFVLDKPRFTGSKIFFS